MSLEMKGTAHTMWAWSHPLTSLVVVVVVVVVVVAVVVSISFRLIAAVL